MQDEVLDVLREHSGPMSAYDVLGQLRHNKLNLAPATIYRALSSLTHRGKVHRLESLNAFVACKYDDHQHAWIMSICDNCSAVDEIVSPDLLNALSGVAAESGFTYCRHIIEIYGICPTCRGIGAKA